MKRKLAGGGAPSLTCSCCLPWLASLQAAAEDTESAAYYGAAQSQKLAGVNYPVLHCSNVAFNRGMASVHWTNPLDRKATDDLDPSAITSC